MTYHLSAKRVPGGFVGVDVFFVISGYLISTVIFSEISEHRFSVLGFYERRVRRILPALFCMLIGVSVATSFLLPANEFVDYAKSVIGAVLSSSNFYFWQHSGPSGSPTSNPLLHTWSLAVEEQFYILFPIFLVIARRWFPRRLRVGVLVLFCVSLAASATTVHYNTTTAFYMPYTRAWELLMGTCVSIGLVPQVHRPVLRQGATLLGFAMICFAVFRFHADLPFPGLAALVPCIGSALIILGGESGSSVVSRLLSLRPVVFVGLISYSLYLWHFPLIVLGNWGSSIRFRAALPMWLASHAPQGKAGNAVVLLLSFAFAILSWQFIERPFRAFPRRIERKPLFALAACTAAALLLFSGAVIYAHGFRVPKSGAAAPGPSPALTSWDGRPHPRRQHGPSSRQRWAAGDSFNC
jgi:peptidoglycan/LPS O-acetylase OafA/YrhL